MNTDDLSKNDILIRVHYSSLNYKDALSATGNKGITKNYPHTPGIDAAGIVVESNNTEFEVGEEVIVTGYDLGMNTNGGFGEYISVPSEWVVKKPNNLTLKEAMIIGTAGFTAGISILKLIETVKPNLGEIVVTGATGGVGSTAIAILSQLGYQVIAISGKEDAKEYLMSLGANQIISRKDFLEGNTKPILSALYAGAIDTVGGVYLEQLIKSVKPLGVVTTCGSVAGTNIETSVFPFILRGISLVGVSAQNYPMELRQKLWQELSGRLKPNKIFNQYQEITLSQLDEKIEKILQGKLIGRTVINLT